MIQFPPEPLGGGAKEVWIRNLMRFLRRSTVLDITGAKSKPQPNGGIIYEIVFPKIPSASSFPWQQPNKELDPSRAVAQWTFVFISQQNTLCTTGLVDLVSGAVTTAQSGIWQALKNIPAQVAFGATFKYNVPAVVVPAAVAGTPLKGDLDNDDLFWVRWPETGACF